MTNEEAIKRIKDHMHIHHIGEPPHVYIGQALFMAMEALWKQTPQEPFIWEEKSYCDPAPNDNWGYECPYCGNRDIDYPDHHCICGQTLDWSELI